MVLEVKMQMSEENPKYWNSKEGDTNGLEDVNIFYLYWQVQVFI